MRIRSDMRIEQKGLVVLNQSVGVFQVGFPLADRLYFGPAQRHACFKFLQKKIIVPRRAVHGRIALAGRNRIAWFVLLRSLFYRMGRLPRHRLRFDEVRIFMLARICHMYDGPDAILDQRRAMTGRKLPYTSVCKEHTPKNTSV